MSSDYDDDDSDRSLDSSVPPLENGPGSENSSNESDDAGAFAWEFFEETDTELFSRITKDEVREEEIAHESAPEPEDWSWVQGDYAITIDYARRELWLQAKAELDLVRDNLAELKITSKEELIDFVFGSKGAIGQCMIRELQVSEEDYLEFMASFFASADIGSSVERLSSNERVTWSLMTPDKCSEIWRKIQRASGDGARKKALWMQLEEVSNEIFRKLFLSSDEGFQYRICLDDDKIHYQFGLGRKTFGLKKQ